MDGPAWEIRLVGGPHEGSALTFSLSDNETPEFLWVGLCRGAERCQAAFEEDRHPHLWFYIPGIEAPPADRGNYLLYQWLKTLDEPFETVLGDPRAGAVYYLLQGVDLPRRRRRVR